MIPIQNIYYMLAYTYKTLRQKKYKKLSTEEFKNTTELLAEILIITLNKQIKQGFEKDYINRTDKLATVKGKINITESIIPLKTNNHIVCQYDEYTTNSYKNRIIKTTIEYLLKQNITNKKKKKLRRVQQYFKNIDTIDIHTINWNQNYNRNNQTYEMLINICQLIIKGLLQNEKQQKIKLYDFDDEERMSSLYERFIREYYKQEHPEIKAEAEKIPWKLDNNQTNEKLPEMRTDITITDEENKKILIIDAKYYTKTLQEHYGRKTIHSANLYQIFTYTKNKQVQQPDYTVSGMLLYAKTDEEEQPDYTYSMDGNKITATTLDLNKNFEEIRKQLDNILEEYL